MTEKVLSEKYAIFMLALFICVGVTTIPAAHAFIPAAPETSDMNNPPGVAPDGVDGDTDPGLPPVKDPDDPLSDPDATDSPDGSRTTNPAHLTDEDMARLEKVTNTDLDDDGDINGTPVNGTDSADGSRTTNEAHMTDEDVAKVEKVLKADIDEDGDINGTPVREPNPIDGDGIIDESDYPER